MRIRSLFAVSAVVVTAAALPFTPLAGMWMGDVAGKDGNPLTGSAMMMAGSEANTTQVDLELKGEAAGTVHPWHIHIGSCTRPGAPFGGGKPYTPITIGADGKGKAKAIVPIAMPDTGSFYANIHESATNMAKIVACGDLKFGKM